MELVRTANHWALMLADGKGRSSHKIVDGMIGAASWGPDSQRFAFCPHIIKGQGSEGIYIASINDHTPRLLHKVDCGAVEWAPNKEIIAFVALSQSVATNEMDYKSKREIWVLSPDGTTVRKLLNGQFESWAPDGQKFVYTLPSDDINDVIYVADISGTTGKKLGIGHEPRWCPAIDTFVVNITLLTNSVHE